MLTGTCLENYFRGCFSVFVVMFVIWILQLTECDIISPLYRLKNRNRKKKLETCPSGTSSLRCLPSDFKFLAPFALHNHVSAIPPLDLLIQFLLKTIMDPYFTFQLLPLGLVLFLGCPHIACMFYVASFQCFMPE